MSYVFVSEKKLAYESIGGFSEIFQLFKKEKSTTKTDKGHIGVRQDELLSVLVWLYLGVLVAVFFYVF